MALEVYMRAKAGEGRARRERSTIARAAIRCVSLALF
jgi:hypothetical protein